MRILLFTFRIMKRLTKWWYVFVAVGLCAVYSYYSLDKSQIEPTCLTTSIADDDDEISASNTKNRTAITAFLEKQLAEALKWDRGTGCNIPYLNPFSEDIAWTYKKLKRMRCVGQDWVKCYHSTCRIVDEVRKTVRNIACMYEDILYKDDFHYSFGKGTMIKDGGYQLMASDHVRVSCIGTDINSNMIVEWTGNILGFRPVYVPPSAGQSLDVVILTFDSTSRSGFIRLMPKSWRVIKKELNATVMKGYNILGDATPCALFPILTGKTELEQPDVRWNKTTSRTLDDFPFIFKMLKKEGYRTAYFEDMPVDGTFQFRFNGFRQQPADHYLRAFRAINSHRFNRWNFCVGDTPQFKMMLNITEQFLDLDGKRFVFTFISDITHEDFNYLQVADDDTAAFLRRLLKRTEDTLIVVMGDHGPRYAAVRKKHSIRGKLDERLPLLAIRLPDRLTRARPHALSALYANARVLTTAHDLHATLLDALDMRRHWNPYKVQGADLKRGLTLMEPIPSNRSCSEAGIEMHWCTCVVWDNVSVSDPFYHKTAWALVGYINWILKDAGSQCVPRTVAAISWVLRQRANSHLLSFNASKDIDAYLPHFNATTNVTYENYQIGVEANPGGAVYEASLMYKMNQDAFVVQTRAISRVNANDASKRQPDGSRYLSSRSVVEPELSQLGLGRE